MKRAFRLSVYREFEERRHFHVRADVRTELDLSAAIFSLGGRLAIADLDVMEELAAWLRSQHGAEVGTATLFAAAASHELLHLLIIELQAAGELDLDALFAGTDSERQALLNQFRELYPPGSHDSELSAPAAREELLLLCLHNVNPALKQLKPLFDDRELRDITAYRELGRQVDAVRQAAGQNGEQQTAPPAGLKRLLAAQLSHPDSLLAQIEWLRQNFSHLAAGKYSELAERLLLAADLLREQEAPHFTGSFSAQAPQLAGELLPHTFELTRASDRDWMRDTVVIAKSCLVWLQQLSDRYGRPVRGLADIPAEELASLAAAGINGLWLIGMWQRSTASREIKRRRGQPDAEASAYAIHDYVIDARLGGEPALEELRERAAAYGIRLVSDMVPNHTGLDSRWVMEHPDWFVQVRQRPFASYGFTGPDLSADPGLTIRIEDHYWDDSDAAVVFQRVDNSTGEARYLYHGNDGTGLPWNDTAQLDFLNPEVRSAVIDTMVAVARRFPVIRFDAAMTLVRRHIQRLWYPPPGEGGAIASRAVHGSLPAAEFETRMPKEFWLEATERLAEEAPDTLLIAEAFWMLEGYFVRNLGMHRVYNSAFMHMLRDEDNDGFRAFIKDALITDPAVLARFVNFMNNPDEDSAAAQFGTGAKYFGVCTLLVTMPGLPMLGHGQLEGLAEKYGMEFSRARLPEQPSEEVLQRHEQEIYPLLRQRSRFSGTDGFELFDFHTHYGVDENVIAFSNRSETGSSLVLYNNRYALADGVLSASVPRRRTGGEPTGLPLADALGLTGQDGTVSWRDTRDGLTYLKPLVSLKREGLGFHLSGYGKAVLLDFTLHHAAGGLPYAELEGELAGRGVADLQLAALELRWRPVRDWLLGLPFDAALSAQVPAELAADAADLARLADRARRLGTLLLREDAEAAYGLLSDGLRIWLLCQGLGTLAARLPEFAPDLPDWLNTLPQRHEPAWWTSQHVSDMLQIHESGGETWFVQEPFDTVVAALYLRAALRAGPEKGRELKEALLAAREFSGWRAARLLQALGARSGE